MHSVAHFMLLLAAACLQVLLGVIIDSVWPPKQSAAACAKGALAKYIVELQQQRVQQGLLDKDTEITVPGAAAGQCGATTSIFLLQHTQLWHCRCGLPPLPQATMQPPFPTLGSVAWGLHYAGLLFTKVVTNVLLGVCHIRRSV